MGVVGVILYVQNRQRFLKKIAVYFTLTFFVALSFSFDSERSIFMPNKQINMSELNNDDSQVESPSVISSAFRFLGSLLKDKISN